MVTDSITVNSSGCHGSQRRFTMSGCFCTCLGLLCYRTLLASLLVWYQSRNLKVCATASNLFGNLGMLIAKASKLHAGSYQSWAMDFWTPYGANLGTAASKLLPSAETNVCCLSGRYSLKPNRSTSLVGLKH